MWRLLGSVALGVLIGSVSACNHSPSCFYGELTMHPRIVPSNSASLKRWEASPDNTFRSKLAVEKLSCFRDKMTEKGHPNPKAMAVRMIGALDSGVASEQREALRHLAESEPEIYAKARAAVYKAYRKSYPHYRKGMLAFYEIYGYAEDTKEVERLLPKIVKGDELDGRISFDEIYIGRPVNGRSKIGIEMSCQWDVEHGMGIIIADGEIERVGHAGVAFDLGPW